MTPSASPENWTPPWELTRALPREIGMTGSGIFIAVLAIVLTLGSIPLFLIFHYANVHDKTWAAALRTEGRETAGQIVRLWQTGGKSHTRMVAYTFKVNGVSVDGDASVPRDAWNGLWTGATLPIRYVPSDTHINHPAAWEMSTMADWVPFVFPAFLAGVGVMLFTILRQQARVAAEGLPAAGVVTKCFRVKGGWAVRYEFRTKDGASARGGGQVSRSMDPGATVCVLYLADNPRRSQMYPMNFYRVTQ